MGSSFPGTQFGGLLKIGNLKKRHPKLLGCKDTVSKVDIIKFLGMSKVDYKSNFYLKGIPLEKFSFKNWNYFNLNGLFIFDK